MSLSTLPGGDIMGLPPVKTKPPASKRPRVPKAPPKKEQVTDTVPAKNFTIKHCGLSTRGKRILLYGDTGVGKSSLALLAPTPVFIPLDRGAYELVHPGTGSSPEMIEGVETFVDVRSVLCQRDIYANNESVVVDTITIMQDLAEAYVVETVKTDKGASVKNLLGYGYNKGYKHLYNVMKLILQDADSLVESGKNVILIAQSINNNVSNPGGEDFLRHGPRLHIDKSWDIQALYTEWADHIVRIAYHDNVVGKDKKVLGTTERAAFLQPEPHFIAKSRTVQEPVVSFADKADDTVWEFIFGKKG